MLLRIRAPLLFVLSLRPLICDEPAAPTLKAHPDPGQWPSLTAHRPCCDSFLGHPTCSSTCNLIRRASCSGNTPARSKGRKKRNEGIQWAQTLILGPGTISGQAGPSLPSARAFFPRAFKQRASGHCLNGQSCTQHTA